MTSQNIIIRPKKAAEILGVSMATFWRLCREQKLRTVKVSTRCTGVMQSEIDRFLSEIAGA